MKALAILPLALAACAPTKPPVATGPIPVAHCDPASATSLIGRSFTDALSVDAKVRTGAGSVRVIRPGMAVTMDYRPERLNIDVDARGVVTRFRCN